MRSSCRSSLRRRASTCSKDGTHCSSSCTTTTKHCAPVEQRYPCSFLATLAGPLRATDIAICCPRRRQRHSMMATPLGAPAACSLQSRACHEALLVQYLLVLVTNMYQILIDTVRLRCLNRPARFPSRRPRRLFWSCKVLQGLASGAMLPPAWRFRTPAPLLTRCGICKSRYREIPGHTRSRAQYLKPEASRVYIRQRPLPSLAVYFYFHFRQFQPAKASHMRARGPDARSSGKLGVL